jgi:very-short-patch-repair endonuclease
MAARNVIIGQNVEETKVLRAKELRREMTPEERTLWHRQRGNRLGGLHFRRQQVIDGFIVDFYWHAAGVVVEVDGPVHDGRVESDGDRDGILAARGLEIMRVRNQEVRTRLEKVLDRILTFCEGGLRNPPNPPAPFPKREGGEIHSPPRFGEGLGEGL